jgi:hypothetical protein
MYLHPHKLREHPHRHEIIWVVGCVLATITFLLIYIVAQQSFRSIANSPQIKIAHDIVSSLNAGKTPTVLLDDQKIDISQSGEIFTVVYDQNGQPTMSSGLINTEIPVVPYGVLQYAKDNGEDRVTWQPQTDIRIAIIVLPYHDGFVLVGRSLKFTEDGINVIGDVVFWAGLSAVALISLVTRMFAVFWAKWYSASRHPQSHS